MNSVTLSGNLTKDPKLVNVDGRAICEMRLAVDGGRKQKSTFVDVRAFDEQAYACAEWLRKGSKMGVQGRLAYSEWVAHDGRKRSRHSVIGRVEFLDPPPIGDGGEGAGASRMTRVPADSSREPSLPLPR